MAYSGWRKDNMSEIEKHRALETLEAFPSFKKIKQKSEVSAAGMSHRMAKNNLIWLKKVRDLQKSKSQVRVQEVQELSEEACLKMSDDLFANVEPEEQPTPSSHTDHRRSSSAFDSDDESETESDDNDSSGLSESGLEDLGNILKDEDFMKLAGGGNQQLMNNIFGGGGEKKKAKTGNDLGQLLGGMMNGVMNTVMKGNNPVIQEALKTSVENLKAMQKKPDLTSQEKKDIQTCLNAYNDILNNPDTPDILSKMTAVAPISARLGLADPSAAQQESNLGNIDLKNMGNDCSIM